MVTSKRSPKHNPKFLLSLALCASLLLAACNAATIITYINSALQVALEFVPLAVPGLPPAVTNYFSASLNCVDFAATEVASMDSNADKSLKITAQCAALVQAQMPPGTPQNIVALASRLATRIADIIAHLPQPVVAAGKAGAPKPVYMKLSDSDLAKLHDIAAQAAAAQAQIAAKAKAVRKP